MLSSAAELDGAAISGVGSSLLKYFGPNKVKPTSAGKAKQNKTLSLLSSQPMKVIDKVIYSLCLFLHRQIGLIGVLQLQW